MQGTMQVKPLNPDKTRILAPGRTYAVQPRTAHYVAGVDDQPCQFMTIQGVGTYDYIRTHDVGKGKDQT
jgi:hypothetical protein